MQNNLHVSACLQNCSPGSSSYNFLRISSKKMTGKMYFPKKFMRKTCKTISTCSCLQIDCTALQGRLYIKVKLSYLGRGVAKGGSRAPPPPKFGRSVNPFQTRGADYARHTSASAPRIKKAIYTSATTYR